jgi:hypothetical protein
MPHNKLHGPKVCLINLIHVFIKINKNFLFHGGSL